MLVCRSKKTGVEFMYTEHRASRPNIWEVVEVDAWGGDIDDCIQSTAVEVEPEPEPEPKPKPKAKSKAKSKAKLKAPPKAKAPTIALVSEVDDSPTDDIIEGLEGLLDDVDD